ncbi:hypothetical protein BGZ80_001733 [Entomortierella chlamydospora]|uniref:RlpA-like protein double-psi beta-barrel domain-containing protein n=1 Tax=Entomortierella chlamydospora TaxID=101097 RepID=A0A9P6N352_9FUNG|nr:hypothetical protein BGZ80_001733 [Entomortierella chlamydospora]
MTQKSFSGTSIDPEQANHPLPALPDSVARSKSHRLPPLPPQPPPHDDPTYLQDLHNTNRFLEKSHTLPPPPPPSKSFYNNVKFPRSNNLSPKFLEEFMARNPRISRHRRTFAAMLCTAVTLLLLLIVLLAVLLSRKAPNNDNYDDGDNTSSDGSGGGYFGTAATLAELKKHNQGISKPPINHSDEPGWTQEGKGNATFYDPSIKNSIGDFQEGACEYPYINSNYDLIAALNKPDFGAFSRLSKSPACGQCLQVTGPDGTVQVQIVDMCPACGSGSLDLTPEAFSRIADLDKGRVNITWTRCP